MDLRQMEESQQRMVKEFLELYNKISHHCFERCVSNFNHPKASGDELSCIDACTNKFINYNQRHMLMYVQERDRRQQTMLKAAATAAAEQAQTSPPTPSPSTPGAGETTSQNLPASPEQGSSPLVQPATFAGAAAAGGSPVPLNMSWDHRDSFSVVHPGAFTGHRFHCDYPGKSIVERFLRRGGGESKSC